MAPLAAPRGFMELKGEGGGSLLHPQPDPLKWGEGKGGARPGRGRGAPGAGLEALAEVLPGGGNRDGDGSLLAPPRLRAPRTPGRGERGGSGGAPSPSSRRVPASQAAVPPVPGRESRGKGLGAGKGDPRARGAGALRPSAGATVPPPAAGGRSCPSSASPRRDRSSRTGKSAGNASLEPPRPLHINASIHPPSPLPGAGAFAPQTAPAPLFRARRGARLFLSLDFPYGATEKRVCQLSLLLLLLLPPRGAGATAPAPRIIAGQPGWSRARR